MIDSLASSLLLCLIIAVGLGSTAEVLARGRNRPIDLDTPIPPRRKRIPKRDPRLGQGETPAPPEVDDLLHGLAARGAEILQEEREEREPWKSL